MTKHSWQGWIEICRRYLLVRSMSRRGASYDVSPRLRLITVIPPYEFRGAFGLRAA